jgi:hypothetical protein
VTAYPDSVAVGDLNGDGLPDLVVGDSDSHYAGILFQDPAHPGTFLGAKYVGATESKPLIADMNRDGIPDLVLFPGDPGQFNSSGVTVLLGDPLKPGSFLAPVGSIELWHYDIEHSVVVDVCKNKTLESGDLAEIARCSIHEADRRGCCSTQHR